jgi:hypothetical protein
MQLGGGDKEYKLNFYEETLWETSTEINKEMGGLN